MDGTQNQVQTIFQYVRALQNSIITVSPQNSINNFAMFGVISTGQIQSCQFQFQYDQTIQQIYGLSHSIAINTTQILNSVINFQAQNVTQNVFTLAENIYADIYLMGVIDKSSIKSNLSSMSSNINGKFNIQKCQFYQNFDSVDSSSMITITMKTGSQIQIQNLIVKAVISSNINNNYGLVKVCEQQTQITINQMKGYISGAYISLASIGNLEQYFDQETLEIQAQDNTTTVIQDSINVNNTNIEFNTSYIESDYNDIQLFNMRSIYYGITFVYNYLDVVANSFALITQNITETTQIQNIFYNMSLYVEGDIVGIAFKADQPLTIQNCTYASYIESYGSVSLLFNQTTQQITIQDLTTNIEIYFSDDSYGLIKYVQGGVIITNFSCNTTMQITGSQLVDSSLMFYSVTSNGNNQIQNVTGIYGGYIKGQVCSSTTCNISGENVNVDIRTISDEISYTYLGSTSINSTYYYRYQVQGAYLGELNGSRVTFNNHSASYSRLMVSVLGDSPVVTNVEINAETRNRYTSSTTQTNYIGCVGAISAKQNYTIINVTVNFTFTSAQANHNSTVGALFGLLNTSAVITNVTDISDLSSGSGSTGGLIGRIEDAQVTITNVTMQGSYYSGVGPCGCIIGTILTGASTSLVNATIDEPYLYSMSTSTGPIYGVNNGTFTQMSVTGNMTLANNSIFNQCPVGEGTYNESLEAFCPSKPTQYILNISGFTCDEEIASNTYHSSLEFCYAINKEMDFNNTNLQVYMGDMGLPYQNRSLFNRRTQYDNITINVINDANMSWGSSTYGFSYVSSVIDDLTTSVSNIVVSASAYGRSYGTVAGITQVFTSNATLTNLSVSLTRVYFSYSAALIYQIRAPNVTITNVQNNMTNGGSGYISCLVSYTYTSGTSFTVQNAQLHGVQNASGYYRIMLYSSNGSSNVHSYDNITVQMKKQVSSSSYYIYVFYGVNGTGLSITNSTFNISSNYSSSYSMLFYRNYISGQTNYTNLYITGNVSTTSSSASSSYYHAALESYSGYGTLRRVTNVTTESFTVIGAKYVAGLFAYCTGSSRQYIIENTTVEASISQCGTTTSTSYLGGFFGYISSSITVVEIYTSSFSNANMNSQVGCLASENSPKQPSVDDEEETCISMVTYTLSTTPTQSTSYSYGSDPEHSSYSSVRPCYWTNSTFDSSGNLDLNYSIFNFTYTTAPSTCGRSSGSWLLSIFPYGFNPSIARNIQTTGTIKLQTYYHIMVTLAVYDGSNGQTVYSNINLNHTNQEVSMADYAFGMAGLIWKIQYGNVSISNCVNQVTHNHNLTSYNSSVCGFVFQASEHFTLSSCTSNFSIYDYYTTTSYEAGSTAYAVGKYLNDSCTATDFQSDWSGGWCE